VLPLEQRSELAKPRERELAVVRAGERAQKGNALQSKEVRQGMLIDDAIVVAGIGAPLLTSVAHS
jgi:hypothetical protein